MNKEINEKISRFLDDELHHSELDNLLLRIKQQPRLKSKMKRYQTMRHALKSDDVLLNAHDSFLDKISQEIALQPHHLHPGKISIKRQWGGWKKTSVALAASVAIVAVTVSYQGNMSSKQAPQMLAQQQLSKKHISEKSIQIAKVSQRTQHERFKAYLQAHSDDLYSYGTSGYQPLAQVANFSQK